MAGNSTIRIAGKTIKATQHTIDHTRPSQSEAVFPLTVHLRREVAEAFETGSIVVVNDYSAEVPSIRGAQCQGVFNR